MRDAIAVQSYQRLALGTIAPRQISVKSNYERNGAKMCRILCAAEGILRMMIASWAVKTRLDRISCQRATIVCHAPEGRLSERRIRKVDRWIGKMHGKHRDAVRPGSTCEVCHAAAAVTAT
ncbi:hypothetical protein [Bosea sp. UC22_33]|uniref:hypothetical protein n=1 Tax=Bosea sp. UC22_33 TaxID=3350165 RepID=UPI00366D4504